MLYANISFNFKLQLQYIYTQHTHIIHYNAVIALEILYERTIFCYTYIFLEAYEAHPHATFMYLSKGKLFTFFDKGCVNCITQKTYNRYA